MTPSCTNCKYCLCSCSQGAKQRYCLRTSLKQRLLWRFFKRQVPLAERKVKGNDVCKGWKPKC